MKNIFYHRTVFQAFLFTTWFFLVTANCLGQISEGGKPLEFPELKSAKIPVVKMAEINNSTLKKNLTDSLTQDTLNKSLVFAHPFELHLTPSNSGEWFYSEEGVKIWRLKISSEGAMSLNLIFDEFQLPAGARLFLFNDYKILGAYTSKNNKPSGKFAVSPIEGDELIVQLEIPEHEPQMGNFVISTVNHDFIGITKYERRPLGITAGECNVDVNCSVGDEWEELKNAVCRLIINGKRTCSGTLVNNTAVDNKPYVLSAAHCFDKWEHAETTVFTFNYESPYCAPLDGDPSNSISGALMKAKFDSLDFALAEMTIVPPPDFRPYFAGWDRTGNIVDSTASIHHPVGDIKKIALDYDSLEYSSFRSNYISNGFLEISRWDEGVTEVGSSGGGMFNKNNMLIGTLTGGWATCANPVWDYYERFDLSWDYHSDSTKQLKYWLDPIDSGVQMLDGKAAHNGSEFCLSFTNLNDNDQHQLISISDSTGHKGYWGGTNDLGITEITEKFNLTGNEIISGISLGAGRVQSSTNDAEITVKVYNGNEIPEELIYAEIIQLNTFAEGVMNKIDFSEPVIPGKTFFIGFELSYLQPTDSFVVFQSPKEPDEENHFFFKKDNTWFNYKDYNNKNAVSNVFEIVACNVDGKHINLKLAEGWNIFSVNLDPEKEEIAPMVQPLKENISLVKIQNEEGNSFEDWGYFGGWKDNIGRVCPAEGFKINLSKPDSFHVFGLQVDYPYPISLRKGWNIMGYPQTISHDAMHILKPLIENGTLEKVQDEKGNSIENHSEIGDWQNNIGFFNPGKGYKIKLAFDDTLWIEEAYPKSTAIIPQTVSTTYFSHDFKGNGVDHMNINITGLQANILQPGDELAVFDGEICVGAISLLPHHFASQFVSIPASARDDFGMPGFTEGNTISVKLWSSSNNREYLPEPEILKGTSTFMKHESTLMSLRKYTSTKLDGELISGKTEINCYPNPFSDEIAIEIILPKAKQVQVDILNQMGQQIKILALKKYLPAGHHTLFWDGKTTGNQSVSPGIYHVRFVTDKIQRFTKIILTVE